MKHLNKNDDATFVLQIKDREGTVLNPTDYSFSVEFFTRRTARRKYNINKGQAIPENVTIKDKDVYVAIDTHFDPGEVMCETIVQIPDELHTDNFRAISSGVIHTNIYIDVDAHGNECLSPCGCCSDCNVSITLHDYAISDTIAKAEAATNKANEASHAVHAAIFAALTATDKAIHAVEAVEAVSTTAENAAEKATEAADKAIEAAGAADTATENANTAKEAANSAASKANAAATNADASKEAATTAAEKAETAAGKANNAATSVNDAKSKAETAAASATAAAENAETAKEAATSAASKANTAATDANAAKDSANEAANKATTAASSANTATENANAAKEAATTAAAKAEAATEAATEATTETKKVKEDTETELESLKSYSVEMSSLKSQVKQLTDYIEFLRDTTGKVLIGYYRVRTDSSPSVTFLEGENETRLFNMFSVGTFGEDGCLNKEFGACSLSQDKEGNAVAIDGSAGDVMSFTKGDIYALMGVNIDDLKVWLFSNETFVYKGHEAHKYSRHARGLHFGVVVDNKMRHIYNKTVRGSWGASAGFTENYSDGYGCPSRAISQFQGMIYNRNKNADTGRNFPYMLPMYWMNDLRTGMCYHEAKTMYLTDPTMFGSGMTTASTANKSTFDDTACTASGGVKIEYGGKSTVVGFTQYLFKVGGTQRYLINQLCFDYGQGLECLEGQRALAYAYKNKIAEGEHFTMPESPSNIDYKYRSVPNCKGLGDGVMTGVVFKYVKMTTLSDGSVTMNQANADLGLAVDDVVNGATVTFQIPIPIWRANYLYGEKFEQHVGIGIICHNENEADNPLISELGAKYYEFRKTEDWKKVPVYTNSGLATTRNDGSNFIEEENYDFVGRMRNGAPWGKETFDGLPMIVSSAGGNINAYECVFNWQSGGAAAGGKENKASAVGCYWFYTFASPRTVICSNSVSNGFYSFVGVSAVPDLSLAESERDAS